MKNYPKDEVYWYTKKKPVITPLMQNIQCDVVVVGGGATGLAAAQAFADKGKKVVLLEQSFCGGGAIGKSSGFITPDSEFGLGELVARLGQSEAKRLWDFANFGVEKIRSNIKENNIDCDYIEADALYVANQQKKMISVQDEYGARKDLNYQTTLYENPNKLSEIVGAKGYHGGVRFYQTFVMNGFLYCQGMKDSLAKQGVQIYETTEVEKVTNSSVQTANGFTAEAQYIIVCADKDIPQLKERDKDVYQVQTYLLISDPLSDADFKLIFPQTDLMVWDSDLNYQYFRSLGEKRIMMGGGDKLSLYNRFPKHNNFKVYKKMAKYFKNRFPNVNINWKYFWPGLLGTSKDFLPLIMHNDKLPNVYFAGAGAGIPWSAAMGYYVCDKVFTGRKDLDNYLLPNRKYPPVSFLQPIIGKPATFAFSDAYIKFIQE